MKLWELRLVRAQDKRWTYDCAYGFIIRAQHEHDARAFAAESSGDEGRHVWLDPADTTCKEVTLEGQPGIVLRDFYHG